MRVCDSCCPNYPLVSIVKIGPVGVLTTQYIECYMEDSERSGGLSPQPQRVRSTTIVNSQSRSFLLGYGYNGRERNLDV